MKSTNRHSSSLGCKRCLRLCLVYGSVQLRVYTVAVSVAVDVDVAVAVVVDVDVAVVVTVKREHIDLLAVLSFTTNRMH